MSAKRLFWLFLVLQMVFAPFEQMSHNISSRFGAMGSFCSMGGFEISPYVSATDDWARTPDGRVFSNKAPGTLFLGAPLYCGILGLQRAVLPRAADTAVRVKNESKLRYALNLILCVLLQMLPWIWICKRWDRKLAESGASEEARKFALIALLFGSTPAIMMDAWVGHPIVAFFSMLALLAIFEGRALLFGFSLGMLQLTEYSSLLLFPAALVSYSVQGKIRTRDFVLFSAGALFPALAWIYYHEVTFGGIFAIANRFQNPMFRDTLTNQTQLWGIFTLSDPLILAKLLFGWWRGILFSQPWVLFGFFALPFQAQTPASRKAFIFAIGGLVPLLLMNAAFGGWHGGSGAGPRYLSAALPVFAIPVALVWDRISPFLRKTLWGALGFSCFVFALAKVFGPTAGLWPEWIDHIRDVPWDFEWKLGLELVLLALFMPWRQRALTVNPAV